MIEVLSTEGTSSWSYSSAPTLFWTIRYLDLGFTIPFGFISLYLLGTRPKSAYPLIISFFGFFITMITAVNAMGYSMYLNNDPEIQTSALVIFGVLGILCYYGFYFFIKDKIEFSRNMISF